MKRWFGFLALLVMFSGCSGESKTSADLGWDQMFPPPEFFGEDCVLDKSMCDRGVIEIFEGTFDSEKGKLGWSLMANYKNPSVNLHVMRCATGEEAARKIEEGKVGLSKSSIVDRPDLGDGGYSVDYAVSFRYSNLVITILESPEEKALARGRELVRYYDEVTRYTTS